MNFFTNNKGLIPALGLLSISIINIQSAQATSDFSSTATVTYTINSIVNTTTTATDMTGLSITGGYTTDTDPVFGSFIDSIGDGVTTSFAAIGDEFVDPVVGSYSKTMAVSGSVNDGVVDAFYLGLFDLFFDNASANSFDIQVTLDYSFSAIAGGQNATNEITLAYANEADTFGNEDSVYAEVPFTLSDSLSNSAVYTFTLAAFGTDGLFVDVGMAGYAESIPAAVPVPGAFWLFGSALMAPVLRKFKKSTC